MYFLQNVESYENVIRGVVRKNENGRNIFCLFPAQFSIKFTSSLNGFVADHFEGAIQGNCYTS